MRFKPTLAFFHVIALSALHAQEAAPGDFLDRYCIDCHDSGSEKGQLNLEPILEGDISQHRDIWEKMVRKTGARQMPPSEEEDHPSEKEYLEVVSEIEKRLDALATEKPDPGEVAAIRRMTRTEYGNAIRDLLGVTVDVSELLPKDESSHGFDNITVVSLSPTLLSRYISAAQKISRIAVAGAQGSAQVCIVRIPADRTQEGHVDGLPPGTRGGVKIEHTFPVTGDYEVEVRLARDRNEEVEGIYGKHTMEILVNNQHRADFTVKPPPGRKDFSLVDAHLKTRIHIEAGTRNLGVTFVKNGEPLLETKREPYHAQFNMHRHPRSSPAVYQVSILGPFDPVVDENRIGTIAEMPEAGDDENAAAEKILTGLMRTAFRRPVEKADLAAPMEFFRQGREAGKFRDGIEMALSSILVSPRFLFKIETDPEGAEQGDVNRLDNLALATRLSFFLWSSLPDEELLLVAEMGKLSEPEILAIQVKRMLADPKAEALTTNFANQWLQLRNLDSVSPDLRLFPDFDDNLREAFRLETELFFQDLLGSDSSVTDLLKSDFTYLNERLAKHYGISGIHGDLFRKVKLDPASHRGGLLRHGSILTVTSYATRTSPVIRGNWILENIIGTPTPPPPADIPALDDVVVSASLPMRERLGAHRADKACASCHNLMDPIGFSLENFDAVGRWREKESDLPVDSTGGLPDGQSFIGITGMEDGLMKRPELFVRTFTEKLLTYALGRGIEAADAPTIRKILRDSAADGYRFSDIILGVAQSVPFTMKKAHVPD